MKMAAIKKISISIVEDNLNIREMLKELFLNESDFDFQFAFPSAEDALSFDYKSFPQVYIMDINLPGKNGIECLSELKQKSPHSQFLMYTVNDDDHRVFEALKAGANGYILKGAAPDQILNAVRELIEGGAPMSSFVARRVVSQFRTSQPTSLESSGLSGREQEVLTLLAQGLLYKEIADKMEISVGTVKQHIHRIYSKLHVQNRTEAVNRYFGR